MRTGKGYVISRMGYRSHSLTSRSLSCQKLYQVSVYTRCTQIVRILRFSLFLRFVESVSYRF